MVETLKLQLTSQLLCTVSLSITSIDIPCLSGYGSLFSVVLSPEEATNCLGAVSFLKPPQPVAAIVWHQDTWPRLPRAQAVEREAIIIVVAGTRSDQRTIVPNCPWFYFSLPRI